MSISSISDAIDTYLEPLALESKFSGSVLASIHGETVYSNAFGKANIELNVNNTTKTVFRIGSITKTFTAVSILQLIQSGKLKLEDCIGDYFPSQKDGANISIHHLLTHTSGIPNYTDDPQMMEWYAEQTSPSELIKRFSLKELEFHPGEKYSYSNSGYILLGSLLEQISGQSYEAYLHEHIFEPLAMSNTGLDDPSKIISLRASGYHLNDDHTLCNAPLFHTSNAYSAGAMYSTVEDLHIWDQALTTEKLLQKSFIDLMFTPYKGDHDYSYGYGWMIHSTPFGKLVAHSGGIPGFTSITFRFLDSGVCIHVLSNIFQDVSEIGKNISGIIHTEISN